MTKLERLKKILSCIDGIFIGFSGGVDSSFIESCSRLFAA